MSSWMWKTARLIYTESGYFNLREMETAHGTRVWGPVTLSELNKESRAETPAFHFTSSHLSPHFSGGSGGRQRSAQAWI